LVVLVLAVFSGAQHSLPMHIAFSLTSLCFLLSECGFQTVVLTAITVPQLDRGFFLVNASHTEGRSISIYGSSTPLTSLTSSGDACSSLISGVSLEYACWCSDPPCYSCCTWQPSLRYRRPLPQLWYHCTTRSDSGSELPVSG